MPPTRSVKPPATSSPKTKAPPKPKGKRPPTKLGPYTYPPTGLCLDDEEGDVVIRSKEGYEWRVRSIDLRSASITLNEMMSSSNSTNTPIPIAHPAPQVHQFLHFILRHHLEPEPPIPIRHDGPRHPFREFGVLISMLEFFQCDQHLGITEQQASLLYTREKRFQTLFILCCQRGWLKLAKVALKEWGVLRTRRGKKDYDLRPANWTTADKHEIGLEKFAAFKEACDEAVCVDGSVDWDTAAEKLRW